MRDNNGRRRAELTTVDVEDGAPYLVLCDKEERVRLAVRLGRDGLPHIGFRDKDGQARMTLQLSGDSAPRLDFWSTAGNRTGESYDIAGVGVSLLFYHENDISPRLMLTEPYLSLEDKSGKTLWKAP